MLTGPENIPFTPAVSPLLDGDQAIHGAVAANGIDAPVAGHYGHPVQEQRALDRGRAAVDMSHRGVVTVTGDDRLTLLNVLTSQKLDDLAPGTSTETLFLDLRGRIDFDVQVYDDGTTSWLTTEPGLNASLAGWLNAMRFAYRVEITDVTEDYAVIGATTEIPGWEELPVWTDTWPQITPGGYPYTVDPEPASHPGVDWTWKQYILPRTQLAELPATLEAHSWSVAGIFAYDALRIAAGRPRQLIDTDDRTIPHELDLLRTAVHLTKGCYKGQETVARVHNLGHPPRRVVQLLIDGSVHGLPAVGSDVILRPTTPEDSEKAATARPVGTLTSVAHHHEMGPVGLAVIKRAVAADAELLIREPAVEDDQASSFTAASQEVLVAPDAGNTVGRPTGLTDLRRRGGR